MPLTMPITQGMLQAFGQPTSRQQVEILINWFDETLQNLIHYTLSDQQQIKGQIGNDNGPINTLNKSKVETKYLNSQETQDQHQNSNAQGISKIIQSSSLVSQDNDYEREHQLQEKKQSTRSNRIQDLLDFTLKELISQVSTQCQERGYLLQKVTDMLLGIERDTITLLKNEKQRIYLKAQSKIMVMKEAHRAEIVRIEQENQDRVEMLQKLELSQKELQDKINGLERDLEETKYKKRKLQRMNNHLIDSLVIKANQLKLANKQFKFKITNQIDDIDKLSIAQSQNTLDPSKVKVQNLETQKLSARAIEVKKILESSQIESDYDGDLNIKLDGFNPSGNVNTGISYLQQNINNQNLALKEDQEKNIKKLLKVKVKLQNLDEDLDQSQHNNSGYDFSDMQKKALNSQANNNQFLSINRNVKNPITPSIRIQHMNTLPSNPNHLYLRHNTYNVQLKGSQENQSIQQTLLLGQDATTPLSKLKDSDQNNIDGDQSSRSDRSGNDSQASSISFDDKSMQFPENDILNESDFIAKNDKDKSSMVVIVQEGEYLENQDNSDQRGQKYQKKFVKTLEEMQPERKMIIDMNVQSDLTVNIDQNNKDNSRNAGQVDDEEEGLLLIDMNSSDEDEDSDDQTSSKKSHSNNQNEGTQEINPALQVKQQEQARKQEMNRFLEGNDDQNIQNLQAEDFGIQHSQDVEEDQQYVQVDERNKIFFQNYDIQALSQIPTEIPSQNQNAFKGKVNTIVNMILDNLKSNKLSKKQLLKLVVTNVLKNEQDEIQQLVIDQIFGQQSATAGGHNNGTMDILNGLPKSALAHHMAQNDSPLGYKNLKDSKTVSINNNNYNQDIQNFKLPTYLYSKQRDEGCQTDALLMIDFLDCGINPAELYKYDKKADKLYKYTFNRDVEFDVVKQQEFIMKSDAFGHDTSIDKKQKPNPIMDKLKDQAKSSKFEIDRCNIILKELLSKIRELEEFICTLEERKQELEDQLDTKFHVKDRLIQQFDLWVNSWHRGFVSGFYRGMSSGYFKGAVESKDYGVQEGYQLGIKDGWQFGFDDGFKNGVRKIYQEAKDKGMDVNLLTPALNIYLSQSEKRQGIQQYIQNKIFKISPFRAIAPVVKLIIEKFNAYNDSKKKHFAKLGLKTVIKMIRQYYQQKVHNKDYMLTEFIFDECQKKFGHNKMAKKAFIQFIASSYYHMNMHMKINLFCSFMHINDKPYSNEVTNFYVQVLDAINNSNIGLKSDYDEKSDKEYISLAKSIEIMKEKLETMLPGEIIMDLRSRLEKLKTNSYKTKQSSIDIDRYMDFMIRSFIKFHVDLSNKPQMTYFSYTLYEANQISFNELNITLEVLGGNTLKMINELREHIEIQKKDLLKLFAEGCREEEKIVIRYVQFQEIIKDSDIFNTKTARDIFAKLPFRGSIQKFQEVFDYQSQELKNQINDIYSNQDIIDRMENMDTKDYWYERIYAIERNIGEVNSTLLFLSLIFVTESLRYLKHYKDRIIRLMWEEKHGREAPDDVDLEQLMNAQVVGQFQEKVIKQQISSKVEEITNSATPTLQNKRLSVFGKKSSGASTKSSPIKSHNTPVLTQIEEQKQE